MTTSYHLTGIMETASGIALHGDGRFDFYYSYGAIDRHGYGTWERVHDVIFLRSEYGDKPGFTIVEQQADAEGGFSIALQQPDPFFAQYMRAFLVQGDTTTEGQADSKGVIRFSADAADRVMVMNDLFPDNIVTLHPSPGTRRLVIAPNHDLLLVTFDNVRCVALPDGLICPIPLLNMMYGERTFLFSQDA